MPTKQRTTDRTCTGGEIDRLGDIFHARLQSERVHFATLSAALAHAEERPNTIFDDLQFRAHRLKGAAAIFEFSEIASAAGQLERASEAAAAKHAQNTDPSVWAALVGLVNLLGQFDDAPTSSLGLEIPEFAT